MWEDVSYRDDQLLKAITKIILHCDILQDGLAESALIEIDKNLVW